MALLNLILERHFCENSDLVGGYLRFGGHTLCTVENYWKKIPCGDYGIYFTWSPKFSHALPYKKCLGAKVPYLANRIVSAARGIRIHCGNTTYDTSGCILVGKEWNFDGIECKGIIKSGSAYIELCDWFAETDYQKNNYILTVKEIPEHPF